MPWPDDDWDTEDTWTAPEIPQLEVDLSDSPVVLAMLLGPDGEALVLLVDRRQVPFGFQAPS